MGYIYKYQNLINGKCYIGQTVDYKKRYREHKNAAYNINHSDHNLPIHKAISKYGLNNFNFEILEDNIDNLDEREKYWIKYFNSYKKGYNCTIGGQDGGGYNGKTVEVYDLNGKYICSYQNAKIAAKKIGVSYSTIQQVLHQKRPTCKQLQLKYATDKRTIDKFETRQGGAIKIYQLTLDGEIIKIWKSIKEASQNLNLDSSAISKCLNGKLKTHGGFKWKKVNKEV